MRALGAILGVVLGTGALAGTIWCARYAPWVPKTEGNRALIDPRGSNPHVQPLPPPPPKEDDAKKPKRPPLADKAPLPKVATGPRVYEFGSMALNEEKKHTFSIKNAGQGPLDLEVGPSSCKCTVGTLSKKKVTRVAPLPGITSGKPMPAAGETAHVRRLLVDRSRCGLGVRPAPPGDIESPGPGEGHQWP